MTAGVTVVLALGACGGDGSGGEEPRDDAEPSESAAAGGPDLADMEAEEVLRLADEALRGAASYTADGTSEVDGARVSDVRSTFATDERCSTSMSTREGSVDVTQDADDLWVRLSPEMLALVFDEEQQELLSNRYLHGPADDPGLADWAEMCQRNGLPAPLLEGQPAESGLETTSLTVEAASEHHGTPVVAVRREESGDGGGEVAEGMTSIVLIAAEGEPYPLRITTEMRFDYGTMVIVTDYGRFDAELPFNRPLDTASIETAELDAAMPRP